MLKKILTLLFLIPLSWVIVHLVALFGFFVAICYPIFWLIFPRKTSCFSCRFRPDGVVCPVCKVKISKSISKHPKTITSIIFSVLVIFAISLTSITLVGVEAYILQELNINISKPKVFINLPSETQKYVSEIFPLIIQLTDITTPVNLIQIDLSYDPTMLKVVNIDTNDSFASIFIQKDINNELGFLRVIGGLPNPGYDKPVGLFSTVYFEPLDTGLAEVQFLPSSLVFANDGNGTNILGDVSKVAYFISPTNDTQKEKRANLGMDVLGAKTRKSTKTNLNFYELTSILGTSTDSAKEVQNIKINTSITKNTLFNKVFNYFLSFILKVDQFILEFWNKINFLS